MLITAATLTLGTQIAECDGFLWDVTEIIKETEKTITVRINSDFSIFKSHWTTGEGMIKTFRKSQQLRGIEREVTQ